MKKYSVVLASVGNPDHGQDPDATMSGVPNKVAMQIHWSKHLRYVVIS